MLVCGPLIARSFSAEFTEWFLWISPGGDWMNGDFAGENGDFALKNPSSSFCGCLPESLSRADSTPSEL